MCTIYIRTYRHAYIHKIKRLKDMLNETSALTICKSS